MAEASEGNTEGKNSKDAEDFNQQTSRRDFLKGIGKVALGVAGAGIAGGAATAIGEKIYSDSQNVRGKVVAQIPDLGDPNDPHRQNLKGNEVWNIDPSHSHKQGEPLAQIDPKGINTVITDAQDRRVDLRGNPISVPPSPSSRQGTK